MSHNGHHRDNERDITAATGWSDVHELSPSNNAGNVDPVCIANLSDSDVTEVKQVAQMQEPRSNTADDGPRDPEVIWREASAARLAAQPNLKPLPPGKNYHVYFCFAEEDLAWVKSTVDILEREHGFRCCFSKRDFKFGTTDIHNINRAIERSAKVVFVVTKASLKSASCSFESEVVTHWGLDRKRRLLILVILEETELPPTLCSLIKMYATDPNFIDKIITDISDDGLTQIEAMDILGGQPSSKPPPTEVHFTLDGLETELDGIQMIMESLGQPEIKAMAKFAFGHGAIRDLPEEPVFLFRKLKDSQKLQSHDVIYLQTLLWKVKRTDLFQKVADEAKRLYRNIGHKMCHLDFPHLKPVPGFNALKFHVAVDMESLSRQRLERLKADVIKAVDIPMESQEYVRVVGIEQGSVWVTIILPQEYAEQLRKTFFQPCTQTALARAQITGVKFSPLEEEMFVQQEYTERDVSKTDSLPNTTPLKPEKENEIQKSLNQDTSAAETSEAASMGRPGPERTEAASEPAPPEPDQDDPTVNWEAELKAARSSYGGTPGSLSPEREFHVNIFCCDEDEMWGYHLTEILSEEFGFSCYFQQRDAHLGRLIFTAIIDSLERSCTVVFLVSPSCHEDDCYRFAVKVAKTMASRGVNLKIIPVMVKKCKLPKAFQSFDCIDATISNSLSKVIKTISAYTDLKKTASSGVFWSLERTTASQKKAVKEEKRVDGGGKNIPWYRGLINHLRAWLPYSQAASRSNTNPERTEEASASAPPEADHSVNWDAELEAAHFPHWSTPLFPPGKDYHVFINYSNEDSAWAIHLVRILEGQFDLKCFLYDRDAPNDRPRIENIVEGMSRSCAVAAMVSRFYLEDHWCSFETEMAVALSVAPDGPQVIPVMLERREPPKELRLFPYIDASAPHFLRKLIEAISSAEDDEDEFAEKDTSCKDTTDPRRKKAILEEVVSYISRRAKEIGLLTQVPDIGIILTKQGLLFTHPSKKTPEAQLKKDIKI